MEMSLKVATPATAVLVSVPNSVAAGPLAMDRVTGAVEEVTVLPNASATLTVRAGEKTLPAVSFAGCWPNRSWVAAAGVMLNAALDAELRPVAAAVSL